MVMNCANSAKCFPLLSCMTFMLSGQYVSQLSLFQVSISARHGEANELVPSQSNIKGAFLVIIVRKLMIL